MKSTDIMMQAKVAEETRPWLNIVKLPMKQLKI